MTTLPSVWPTANIVIFDCDSTLSTIEGIDELARMTGYEYDVAMLTKRAMEGDVPLESVYSHRLVTVNPTQEQVRAIANHYRQTVVPDAREVIEALQTLGTVVFIVSGGLIEPVRDFGVWLGVPRDHIFAVNMEYDQLAGKWWRYWELPGGANPRANYLAVEPNPLTSTQGKNQIVSQIRSQNPGRVLMIGDGLSDLEVAVDVDLFVGFGGAVFRQRIADEAAVYIHTLTLAPLLPLALGQFGNTPRFARLWADGLQRVYNNETTFRDTAIKNVFLSALRGERSER
ncbi:MAG: HAD family hydrolase [Anaerolineales bacterium]|jgi:phosphoserine phosphatase|nr:HAD family hydrolase [Anaerolineales bacterium]